MEQKEEILSPMEVGDNRLDFVLKDDLKLVYGWFDGQYYLRLIKGVGCLAEWFRKDDVIRVKSIEKDVVDKVSHCLPESKRSDVKKLITTAYFEYATKKSQLNTEKQGRSDTKDRQGATWGHEEGVDSIFFDNKLLTETKTAATGWFKNQLYFGIMLPVKQPKINKEGEILGEEIVPKLVWIFNDKTHSIITQKYQQQNTITIKGELTDSKERWSLTKLQEWLHATKTHPYPTLSPTELFNNIKEQFKKYLWFDDEQYYNILPLWIIGTYCYQIFQAYPYINLWGFKNSGKTKVMDLTSILTFNSASFVNMSVASLFRIIELDNPTLFIDEAENLWKPDQKADDDTSEIVACLNAGWMKGKQVPRVEKIDGKQTVIKFDVYCPKMLASIKGLKGALDTRCIRIIMVRPIGQSSSQLWMEEDDPELLCIRDEIYPFVLENWGLIKCYYSGKGMEVKNEFGIDNRDWQIWKPLLAIAKVVSDDLVKELGDWAREECEMNKEEDVNEESWDTKVMKALLSLVQSDELKKYYMKEIKDVVDQEFVEKQYFDNFKNEEVKVFMKNRPSSSYIGRLLNKVGFRKDKFKSGERGYWFNKKKIASVAWSVSRISVPEARSVQVPDRVQEQLLITIKSLKNVLQTTPSFIQIKEQFKDVNEDSLFKTLQYMKKQGIIFEPAGMPDHYEVLE
jgi:hypothetical protein